MARWRFTVLIEDGQHSVTNLRKSIGTKGMPRSSPRPLWNFGGVSPVWGGFRTRVPPSSVDLQHIDTENLETPRLLIIITWGSRASVCLYHTIQPTKSKSAPKSRVLNFRRNGQWADQFPKHIPEAEASGKFRASRLRYCVIWYFID